MDTGVYSYMTKGWSKVLIWMAVLLIVGGALIGAGVTALVFFLV
jgi:hypothetical protein